MMDVGGGKRRRPPYGKICYHRGMSRYRRANIKGGTFFFTVTLADRSSDLLVRHIDHLRSAYEAAHDLYPFKTVAICILPDHLHAIWTLPSDDADFPLRWSLIKSKFSRALPIGLARSASKVARREKASGSAATGNMRSAMRTI